MFFLPGIMPSSMLRTFLCPLDAPIQIQGRPMHLHRSAGMSALGKMVFALDNFTSNNVALWSYEKITCISDTLYFHILAGDNLIG